MNQPKLHARLEGTLWIEFQSPIVVQVASPPVAVASYLQLIGSSEGCRVVFVIVKILRGSSILQPNNSFIGDWLPIEVIVGIPVRRFHDPNGFGRDYVRTCDLILLMRTVGMIIEDAWRVEKATGPFVLQNNL